jgi:Barstar (barnase inhibitor)
MVVFIVIFSIDIHSIPSSEKALLSLHSIESLISGGVSHFILLYLGQMSLAQVVLDGNQLATWDGFHTECATVFSFPAFYGRNRDAWIDCLTDVDGGLTQANLQTEEDLLISIENSSTWVTQAPLMVTEFVLLVQAVNLRFKEAGLAKKVAVVFC